MGGLFEVRVESTFDAGHRVGADGAPSARHEHRWRVAVTARSSRLDRIAIVVDFRKLRARLDAVLAELRGRDLEEVDGLETTGAYGVAGWLLRRMREACDDGDYRIDAVEVQCDPAIIVRVRNEGP